MSREDTCPVGETMKGAICNGSFGFFFQKKGEGLEKKKKRSRSSFRRETMAEGRGRGKRAGFVFTLGEKGAPEEKKNVHLLS